MKSLFPKTLGYQIGLIGFTRLSTMVKLTHYGIDIHPRYFLRLVLIAITSLLTLPLRISEQLVYGTKINKTQIKHPPIFIIGHWRSGTTYLHNLMTQDPNYGYVSMYQSIVPDCSLIGHSWLKQLLGKIIPIKRPMDNVHWPIDGPQEDEVGLAKTLATGFYVQFLFPSKAKALFRKFVLQDGAAEKDIAEFKHKYQRLFKIATLQAEGKPLISKNPVNTARIRLLLELFPNAKFIHICRSPYDVFQSARNLHQKLSVLTTLQKIDKQRADETVLVLYQDMMKRYLAERHLIPAGQLVEVKYEDLDKNPLAILQHIYHELNLSNFEANAPAFQAFLEAQKTYQKNQFQISPDDQRTVEQHWDFAFSAFNYDMQAPIVSSAS